MKQATWWRVESPLTCNCCHPSFGGIQTPCARAPTQFVCALWDAACNVTLQLAGKTLLITGASRGIGLAIALRAARDGANVTIAAKTVEAHPKLPGTLSAAASEYLVADVASSRTEFEPPIPAPSPLLLFVGRHHLHRRRRGGEGRRQGLGRHGRRSRGVVVLLLP